jgi:hypothetical protein
MKFLPLEEITYKTKLNENEIIKRLSDNMEPLKANRFRNFSNRYLKPYQGQINGHMFEVKRIITYRNSFLPRINGIISSDPDGTIIKVKMRLHVFIIVFMCCWFSAVIIGCIAAIAYAIDSPKLSPFALIPLIMLIGGYVMTMGGFKSESAKSKKDLQKIFEADTMEK